MAHKINRARDVVRPRGSAEFWIDHAQIAEEDFEWMKDVERLTLWNVRLPEGFLAHLDRLWWLDLRGGSGMDLAILRGARSVRCLKVNQVRGMTDLSAIVELHRLRYLDLYGLTRVKRLPSFARLESLERACLGQMRGLESMGGVLDAPRLKELLWRKKVGLSYDQKLWMVTVQ